MDAAGIAAGAPFGRRLRHLDLREQVAHRRIPAGELDAGRFTDRAASAVAADEILRAQRLTVGECDVHTVVVLRETGRLDAVVDRDLQLAGPFGQDALDVVLPQPKPVVVPGRKVADVQGHEGEGRDLSHLPLRGTDRRCRADRRPRSCASAARPRASRRVLGSRAARRWQRRRPLTRARPPTSVPSGRPQRSPLHAPYLPYASRDLLSVSAGSGVADDAASRPRPYGNPPMRDNLKVPGAVPPVAPGATLVLSSPPSKRTP